METQNHQGNTLRLLLERWRLQTGKDLKVVASELGIAYTTLSRRKKDRTISPDLRQALAAYFGVPLQTFDDPPPALLNVGSNFEFNLPVDPPAPETSGDSDATDEQRILKLIENIYRLVEGLPPGEERANWVRTALTLAGTLEKKAGRKPDSGAEAASPGDIFRMGFSPAGAAD